MLTFGKPHDYRGTAAWIGLEVSRLFRLPCQRHRSEMILDLLIQFAVELVRAIMVDALSGRVQGQVSAFRRFGKLRGTVAVIRYVHGRNRERLLHRLRTELNEDL